MRARRLIGLSVHSARGPRLGRVQEILIGLKSCQFAVVLSRSPRWRPPLYLLPASRLCWLNTRLVIDEDQVASEPVASADLHPWCQIAGRMVRSACGRELGWLYDAELGPSGTVVGWLVSQGAIADLLQGLQRLPPHPLSDQGELLWHAEWTEGEKP